MPHGKSAPVLGPSQCVWSAAGLLREKSRVSVRRRFLPVSVYLGEQSEASNGTETKLSP